MDRSRKVLLNIQDLMCMLNFSRSTISRMASTGEMPPPIKLGRHPRWHADTIDEWLKELKESA